MREKISVTQIATLTGHKGAIFALEKAVEAPCFFSGDGNGWIAKWDLTDTSTAKVIAQVPSNIFALCLLEKVQLLAVGSMQGVLYFIDLQNNKVIPPTLKLGNAIFSIKQRGDYLYIGTGEGTLVIFHIPSLKVSKQVNISTKSIRQITLHPTQPIATLACSDHKIYVVDLVNYKVRQHLIHHQNSVFSTCFTKDGQYLWSGSRDAHLARWELGKQYELITTAPAHLFTINSLVQSPNQQWVATGSRDRTIKIWSAKHGNLLKVIDNTKSNIQGHQNSVNILHWSTHQQYLLSGSDDRTIMVWKITQQ